ncbi:MAG: hypothetical protein AAFQ07_05525, partial [Chloroflexota bacterium]
GGGDYQTNPVSGNIYIRAEPGRNQQVRDLAETSPGDGIVTEDYSGPAVIPPYDFGDFAPGGVIEQALGGRNRPVGHPLYDPNGLYIDLSHRCQGNKVDHQVFGDYGNLQGNSLNNLESAVYYASCEIHIDRQFEGTATFISADKIETSQRSTLTSFDFSGYDLSSAISSQPIEDVLFVSNEDIQNANCTGTDHAIRLSGVRHDFSGDIVAFRGLISVDTNQSDLNSCIMGWGVRLNGGPGTTITCQPGVSNTNTQTNFGMVE